jgi:uncharacterized membrane protein
MIDTLLPPATLLGLVGCGLMAGLFLAFSTAVMPGLRRLAPDAGAAAMQQINRAILNPLFGVVFGGTALVCLVLALGAPFSGRAGSAWLVGGALLYLAGSIVVTMAVNVPMNNRLDAADPAAAAELWPGYLTRWTAWNHIRAAACTAATAALAIGLWS